MGIRLRVLEIFKKPNFFFDSAAKDCYKVTLESCFWMTVAGCSSGMLSSWAVSTGVRRSASPSLKLHRLWYLPIIDGTCIDISMIVVYCIDMHRVLISMPAIIRPKPKSIVWYPWLQLNRTLYSTWSIEAV